MKKETQLAINKQVKDFWKSLQFDLDYHGHTPRKPFRKCTATVCETLSGIKLLYSYHTLVAAIDLDGRCWDFLRMVYGYTATSNQHICKFCKDYGAIIRYSYKPVQCRLVCKQIKKHNRKGIIINEISKR